VEYLVAMPFLFFLFVYYLFIAFKEDSAVQKPEKLYKEKKLIAYVFFLMVIFLILTFSDIPILNIFYEPHLIHLS